MKKDYGKYIVCTFININWELKGVIDPNPVVGDRIYCLIYAICYKPEFLENIEVELLNDVFNTESYTCQIQILIEED